MVKFIFNIPIIFFFISCAHNSQDQIEILSPNGKYTISLNVDGELSYSVRYGDATIIKPSLLGFIFDKDASHTTLFHIKNVKRGSVNSSWKPVYGEKNEYPESYNEAFITLEPNDNHSKNFAIRIRAYDEGVAFRYEFSDVVEEVVISGERTEFSVPEHASAWVSERAQSEITRTPVSEIEGEVERPLLIELPDHKFVAIGEAGLIDFARMKFKLKGDSTLESSLGSEVIFDHPFVSPWRYVMASEQPGELVENNYLLLNLNEPNKLKDTSWIKSGKVIREVTLTTQGGLACVDFAEKHNLQFVEFDAGWYGPEYDDLSDASTITVDPKRSKGPLDLHRVIAYAKSKGIGIVLYVNRRALERQIDEILPLYQSWGIAGVKYGFVNVGSQQWTSWLHEAIRKAADHKLMVDIHDEYRPSGYSRTYPNLMTQEGIRGDEESPDNSMVLNTFFTRMIAGAGDHTNCYMASRVDEKMGSHASQMAKAICIYSPWQFLFWYDRPLGSPSKKGGAGGAEGFIPEIPDLQFYDQLPAVWDDTKVIEGYPGKYVVVARRSGATWFVGCLAGDEQKNVKIPLDFLDEKINYTAQIFSDDDSMNTSTNVKINSIDVDSGSVINSELSPLNGMAMIIAPK